MGVRFRGRFVGVGAAQRGRRPCAGGQRDGTCYALDLKEGFQYWTFDADATVRTAMAIGDVGGEQTAFFGDVYGNVHGVTRPPGSCDGDDTSTTTSSPE